MTALQDHKPWIGRHSNKLTGVLDMPENRLTQIKILYYTGGFAPQTEPLFEIGLAECSNDDRSTIAGLVNLLMADPSTLNAEQRVRIKNERITIDGGGTGIEAEWVGSPGEWTRVYNGDDHTDPPAVTELLELIDRYEPDESRARSADLWSPRSQWERFHRY